MRALADHVSMTTQSSTSIVLRHAGGTDGAALQQLAQLDSKHLPSGPFLVAERDGAIIAAVGRDGDAIADPFQPTADAVALLRRWARQQALSSRRRGARRLRPALAA